LAAAAWEGTMQGGGAIWKSEGTAATYLWREEKSHRAGVRRGHEKPADTLFAKPRKVWHFCQFSSSKCQLAQNAKPKCQTIGPLFFSFLANSKMQNPFANSLGAALTSIKRKGDVWNFKDARSHACTPIPTYVKGVL